MIDPVQHQLEIALLALRRWQDELNGIYDEPDPVRREVRRQEALRWIERAGEQVMEVLRDG